MRYLSKEALRAYYHFPDATVFQTALFNVSRFYTDMYTGSEPANKEPKPDKKIWPRWNKVADKLFLGKIPTFPQHEDIKKFINDQTDPIGLVVSVVDVFELSAMGIVSPQHWQEHNVAHFMIPMRDFSAEVDNETMIAAVLAMRKCIEEGKSVYTHCKAGRSRSAMLCAIYIAMYGNGTSLEPLREVSEEEIKRLEYYLIQIRPQVDIGEKKRLKAVEIIKQMQQMQKDASLQDQLAFENINLFIKSDNNAIDSNTKLNLLLSSLQLKNAIIHFLSFKKLAIWACQSQGWVLYSTETEAVRNFFKSIYDAANENWYLNLMNSEGPMKDITSPALTELLKEFINELNNYLANTLQCTVEELNENVKGLLTPSIEVRRLALS